MRALWLAGLTGCSEFGIDPIDPTDVPVPLVTVTERFVQAPLPDLDLLLVVDDTASMAQEQAALAGAFEALADGLAGVGIDWQLGVASTTMDGTDAGWLVGTPWVLTPDTPDAAARFSETVRAVGTDGPGPEAGLAAAGTALALAAPDGPNAGFRRPGAALEVVFFSDADDASDGLLDAPADDFLDALGIEAERTGRAARASAIAGDVPGGCVGPSGTAQAGTRYAEVVEATGGAFLSICSDDLGPLLSGLGPDSAIYPQEFPLAERPREGSLRVNVDGERAEDGWTLLASPPTLSFDEPPPPESVIEAVYVVEAD